MNGKTADVVLPDYHNYTQLVAELEQLADSYTSTSQLYIQGSTVEGRQLAVIRISGDVQQVGNHSRTEERGLRCFGEKKIMAASVLLTAPDQSCGALPFFIVQYKINKVLVE